MAMRHLALLRGINVGRNKRIAMADLRDLVRALGYTEVTTHLQSGNVLLTAAEEPATLAQEIQGAISRELALEVSVLVRTQRELDRVVEKNPLAGIAKDPTRLLIAFLSVPPQREWFTAAGIELDDTMLGMGSQELYIWCPDGILASPILAALGRVKQPGLVATSRNLRTVTKLQELIRVRPISTG